MVFDGFSIVGVFCLEDDLGSFFEQFPRQICPPNAQQIVKKQSEIKVGIWKQILVEKGGPDGFRGH